MGGVNSSENKLDQIELLGPDGTYNVLEISKAGRSVAEFHEKYELLTDILGKGNYAEVRLAILRETGKEFAVKMMVKESMDDDDLKDMRKEVTILQNLNHKNIVKLYEYYEDDENVFIVMEYLTGGELYSGIEEIKDFTENDIADIVMTLLQTLKYCKDRGIVHRDVKPSNILLRYKPLHKQSSIGMESVSVEQPSEAGSLDNTPLRLMKNDSKDKKRITQMTMSSPRAAVQTIANGVRNIAKRNTKFKSGEKTKDELGFTITVREKETSIATAKQKYEIVLADFGFATQVPKSMLQQLESLQTQCGTPLFTAPEIMTENGYNYKCDIWAVGIITYMLLSGGEIPFPATNSRQLYKKVLKGEWGFHPPTAWANVSFLAKDFVKKILVNDVKLRADYEDLLEHPWLKQRLDPRYIPSVNLKQLKVFNAKRKVLRHIKTKQAALKFKAMMFEQDGVKDNKSTSEVLAVVPKQGVSTIVALSILKQEESVLVKPIEKPSSSDEETVETAVERSAKQIKKVYSIRKTEDELSRSNDTSIKGSKVSEWIDDLYASNITDII